MRTAAVAVALSFVLATSTAAAQTAAPASPAGPYVAPPPAPAVGPPAEKPGGFRHDGFYFSVALGASYVYDSIGSNWFGEASLSGVGLADKIAFGGTIVPGLVLGGAIEDNGTLKPVLLVDGKSEAAPHVFGLSLVGPFVDFYPDPSNGLHMQALLGISAFTADDSDDLPVGFGGSLSAGYEWWLGPQSSLGFLARISLGRAWFHGHNVEESHSAFTPALLLQYTYH
jgi:hypothetical protein